MEIIIFGLFFISLWLAFIIWKKNSALRSGSSMLSIASQQIHGLKGMSLHNYWTGIAMAIMNHRNFTFEEAIVLLNLGNAHPDVNWDEILNVYKVINERAEIICQEFDAFIKEEAELIIKERVENNK